MSRYFPEEYKKDIVRLYHKRAPEVTRKRFAGIHDLSDTTVRDWVLKHSTGHLNEEKGNREKNTQVQR